MSLLTPIATGLVLALVISAAAYVAHSLNRSGAVAATVLGTIVYAFGGWRAAVVLLVFFVSSSLLDRWTRKRGRRPAGLYAKGGRRDAGQVLGNGLPAAIFAVLAYFKPEASWPWIGLAGGVAAVNADTWATELGAFAAKAPRLITRLSMSVPPGTSGGVSAEGSLAAVLGSALVGTVAVVVAPTLQGGAMAAVTAGGIAGAFLDSYLGATVQTMYRCTAEGLATEQHPTHRCGAPTIHVRGWSWFNNDIVNLACGMLGAATALLMCFAF